jgi:hypothetical protein
LLLHPAGKPIVVAIVLVGPPIAVLVQAYCAAEDTYATKELKVARVAICGAQPANNDGENRIGVTEWARCLTAMCHCFPAFCRGGSKLDLQ